MNAQTSRRQWLNRMTVTTSAALLFSRLHPLLAEAGSRGFKIGAPDWSLKRFDTTCFDLAKQIGLDGVQLDLGNPENGLHLRHAEVQQSYLEASRKSGVAIGGLALGALNETPLKSEPRAAIWVHDSIEAARALRVKVILVAQFWHGDVLGDAQGIDRTVAVLQELAPRAERAGVILGLENYLGAAENLAILDRVNSPAVQVYYDVGNSTDKGYDIYSEIRQLKGRICEFHAKDGNFMLGEGRVDFKKVRAAIDDIGYRGWIQIEAAAPHGIAADYTADLKYLRSIFPATESNPSTHL
jgi:L-ribulose-5-phosphate 3-epimerase